MKRHGQRGGEFWEVRILGGEDEADGVGENAYHPYRASGQIFGAETNYLPLSVLKQIKIGGSFVRLRKRIIFTRRIRKGEFLDPGTKVVVSKFCVPEMIARSGN